jgi:hypothetical protein
MTQTPLPVPTPSSPDPATAIAGDGGRLSNRTRAWLWSACAAVLALIYLVLWSLYGMTHLSVFPRFEQRPPGATASLLQADFSLLSLVHSDHLTVQNGEAPALPAGAVWVVATLQVVQHGKDPAFTCYPQLIGPDHRVWERTSLYADRALSSFCSDDDLYLGRPYRFEEIFQVPARYADQLYGVVMLNGLVSTPQQVLTPPA